MRQQVYNMTGQLMADVSNEKCLYSEDTLRQMVAAGYKIKVDGKVWHPSRKKTEGK